VNYELKTVIVFTGPLGGDIEGEGERLGVGVGEVGAGEPGDLVLGHGDVKLVFVQHIIIGIMGGDREMDGAGGVMQEGVEVELLLGCRGVDLELLRAVHAAKACGGIERATAALPDEAHQGHLLGIVIGDDKTTERDNTLQGGRDGQRAVTHGDDLVIEERVRITDIIRELYLLRIGHRGVTLAAMRYDHQLVVALGQLERGGTEVRITQLLVGLLDTVASHVIEGEVQA